MKHYWDGIFCTLIRVFKRYLNHPIKSIYKPSKQKEAVLGFDQAWLTTKISENEFDAYLSGKGKNSYFDAYLLQFKVVTTQKYQIKEFINEAKDY